MMTQWHMDHVAVIQKCENGHQVTYVSAQSPERATTKLKSPFLRVLVLNLFYSRVHELEYGIGRQSGARPTKD